MFQLRMAETLKNAIYREQNMFEFRMTKTLKNAADS